MRRRLIDTKVLGNVPSGFSSKSVKIEPINAVEKFVNNEIRDGPQVVTLPTPPYRHAFLVNITPNRIKISDWGGDNRNRTDSESDFTNYTQFMDLLEIKYRPRKIEYYPIDRKQYAISDKHHDKCNGGGCSNYIYAWIEKHNAEIWEDAAPAPAASATTRKRSRSRLPSVKASVSVSASRKKHQTARSRTASQTRVRRSQRSMIGKV